MRESKMWCFRPCRPSVYLIVATNQSLNIWLGQVILNSRVYRSSASWADIVEPADLNIRHLIGWGGHLDQSGAWDLVHILDNDLDRTDQVQNYARKQWSRHKWSAFCTTRGQVTSVPTLQKRTTSANKRTFANLLYGLRLGTSDLDWHWIEYGWDLSFRVLTC